MSQNRFLPVYRKPRRDGWTSNKQWRFDEALAESALMSQALRASGLSALPVCLVTISTWKPR